VTYLLKGHLWYVDLLVNQSRRCVWCHHYTGCSNYFSTSCRELEADLSPSPGLQYDPEKGPGPVIGSGLVPGLGTGPGPGQGKQPLMVRHLKFLPQVFELVLRLLVLQLLMFCLRIMFALNFVR